MAAGRCLSWTWLGDKWRRLDQNTSLSGPIILWFLFSSLWLAVFCYFCSLRLSIQVLFCYSMPGVFFLVLVMMLSTCFSLRLLYASFQFPASIPQSFFTSPASFFICRLIHPILQINQAAACLNFAPRQQIMKESFALNRGSQEEKVKSSRRTATEKCFYIHGFK